MPCTAHPVSGGMTHQSQLMSDMNGVYQYGTFIGGGIDESESAVGYTGASATPPSTVLGHHYVYRRRISDGAIMQIVDLNAAYAHGLGGLNLGRLLPSIASHLELSIGVDHNNHLHIVGNNYGTQAGNQTPGLHWIECADPVNALGTWIDHSGTTNDPFKTWIDGYDAIGGLVYIYNRMHRLPNGTLLWWFFMMSDIDRDMFLVKWTGTQWALVSHPEGMENPPGVASGYMGGLFSEPSGRLHLWGMYKNQAQNPWYMYCDGITRETTRNDYEHFKSVTGAAVSLPITEASFPTIAVDSYVAPGPIFTVGMCVDGSGYPHFCMSEGTRDSFWYKHFWYASGAWHIQDLSTQFRAGIHWIDGQLWVLHNATDTWNQDPAGSLATMKSALTPLATYPATGGRHLFPAYHNNSFWPGPDDVRLRDHGVFSLPIQAVSEGGLTTAPNVYEFGTGGPPTPPSAAFTFDTPNGRTVQFHDTSSGSITGWAWTFGDGGVSTLQHPSHTYSTDGTKTVRLTVTNAGGSTYVEHSVTVSQTVVVSSGGLPTWHTGSAGSYPQLMSDIAAAADPYAGYQYGIFYSNGQVNGNWGAWAFRRRLSDGLIIAMMWLPDACGHDSGTQYNPTTGNSIGTNQPYNPLGFPLPAWDGPEPEPYEFGYRYNFHLAMVIGVDDQGRVHITGNTHQQRNMANLGPVGTARHNYISWHPNDGAFDNPNAWTYSGNPDPFISSATDATATNSLDRGNLYTYNVMARSSSNKLYWYMIQADGPYINAGTALLFKRQGGAWHPLSGNANTTRGELQKPSLDNDTGNAYANATFCIGVYCQPRSGTHDRIWFAGYWRTDFNSIYDNGANSSCQPFVIYSDNAETVTDPTRATWFAVDGTPQPVPITWPNAGGGNRAPSTIGYVANGIAGGAQVYSLAPSACGFLVDSDGHPHLMLVKGTLASGRLSHLWHDGSAWQHTDDLDIDYERPIYNFKGGIWMRALDDWGGGRTTLFPAFVSPLFRPSLKVGPRVPQHYNANPDPVRLARHGIWSSVFGDDEAPKVYEVGDNARKRKPRFVFAHGPTDAITMFEEQAGSLTSLTVVATGRTMPHYMLNTYVPAWSTLPAGVTFVDNLDGTATLSGVPQTGTAGTWLLQVLAYAPGIDAATQMITLTVEEAIPGGETNVPPSIDGTGNVDSTLAWSSFLQGLPPNAVVNCPPGATYKIDGTVTVHDKDGIEIFGNNSTWRAATFMGIDSTGTPNIPGTLSQVGRNQFTFTNCHNVRVHDMNVVGAMALGNLDGDYGITSGMDLYSPNFQNGRKTYRLAPRTDIAMVRGSGATKDCLRLAPGTSWADLGFTTQDTTYKNHTDGNILFFSGFLNSANQGPMTAEGNTDGTGAPSIVGQDLILKTTGAVADEAAGRSITVWRGYTTNSTVSMFPYDKNQEIPLNHPHYHRADGGSWITDGWKLGMKVIALGWTQAANGIIAPPAFAAVIVHVTASDLYFFPIDGLPVTEAAGQTIRIKGANELSAYVDRAEQQHAYRFAGCRTIEVDNCTTDLTLGDGISFLSTGVGSGYQYCEDVYVHHCTFSNRGRQGVAGGAVRRFVLRDNTFIDGRRTTIDIEASGIAGWGWEDIWIIDNDCGDSRLNGINLYSTGELHRRGVISGNTGHWFPLPIGQGGFRDLVHNITTDVWVIGNTAPMDHTHVTINNGTGIVVRDNNMPTQGADPAVEATNNSTDLNVDNNIIAPGTGAQLSLDSTSSVGTAPSPTPPPCPFPGTAPHL